MTLLTQVALLAQYNTWMNQKTYEAAAKLTPEELQADKQAFFGSILGTLNHIMVADIIWLQRFAKHPSNFSTLAAIRAMETPRSLSQILHPTLPELFQQRQAIDQIIVDWCQELTEDDLNSVLVYENMKKQPQCKLMANLLLHFFNHQTHHRGQATTLLFQAGVDVGITDLVAILPHESTSV